MCEPLHVERLSETDTCNSGSISPTALDKDRDCRCACQVERGYAGEDGAKETGRGRMGEAVRRVGDGGAYIFESREMRRGEVRAASSWRTLSHCV